MSCFLSCFLLTCFISTAQENIDTALIQKIRHEAFNNSKVMNTAFYLTDVSGPRLTGSPGWNRAASWAKDQLTKFGLQNVAFEKWGEVGKGWEVEKSYLAMKQPYYQALLAFPDNYSGSTAGLISGEVIMIKVKDTSELRKYDGKLKGKIVKQWSDFPMSNPFEPYAKRYDDHELQALVEGKTIVRKQNNGRLHDSLMRVWRRNGLLRNQVFTYLKSQNPALILGPGGVGNGAIFVEGGNGYQINAPEGPAIMSLSLEDDNRLQRLWSEGIPVHVEAELKTKFFSSDLNGYNVIAELPGSDPVLKNEIVMIGAHLDSWTAGTGATDNAAGSAVMIEAMRILKAIGVKPRRTIRLALWNAEELGLRGSEGYVKEHFANIDDMKPKHEHSKISVYYNYDNGTGRIRGIYTNGNKEVLPIFQKWLEPFQTVAATTVTTMEYPGSSDNFFFDRVGIPSFAFIQDEIDYSTRTHHTNLDTYDHLVPEDLKQSAMIIAAFAYQSAMRDDKLPRKELPKARPKGGGIFD